MSKPPVLQADCTIPLSKEQRDMYTTLEPHYKEQCAKHPGIRWLRSHYGFIVGALRSGFVHSREDLVAGAGGSD